MKRAISIIILVLYVIPTIGVSVNLHFCGGKLSTIAVWSAKSICKCAKKTMKKGCCKQQQATYKISDKQCLTESAEKVTLVKKDFQCFYLLNKSHTPNYRYISFVSDTGHPPPLLKLKALYVLHQSFLI